MLCIPPAALFAFRGPPKIFLWKRWCKWHERVFWKCCSRNEEVADVGWHRNVMLMGSCALPGCFVCIAWSSRNISVRTMIQTTCKGVLEVLERRGYSCGMASKVEVLGCSVCIAWRFRDLLCTNGDAKWHLSAAPTGLLFRRGSRLVCVGDRSFGVCSVSSWNWHAALPFDAFA